MYANAIMRNLYHLHGNVQLHMRCENWGALELKKKQTKKKTKINKEQFDIY